MKEKRVQVGCSRYIREKIKRARGKKKEKGKLQRALSKQKRKRGELNGVGRLPSRPGEEKSEGREKEKGKVRRKGGTPVLNGLRGNL